MAKRLRIRRGNFADLPTLSAGEFGFTEDTGNLYIGQTSGTNKLLATLDISSLSEIDAIASGDKIPVYDVSTSSNKYVEAGDLGDYTKEKYRLYNQKFNLIPHRGFVTTSPQNTLMAFSAAVAAGCTSIELDVQITSDGVPIVFHDDGVSTLTNGTGYVKEITSSYVSGLVFDSTVGTAFANAKIPTFDEVCKWASKVGVKIIPEIKGYRTQADISLMYDIVVDYNLQKNCLFQSFNQSDLDYVRTLDSDIEIGLLCTTYSATIVDGLSLLKNSWLLIDYGQFIGYPERVDYCYSKGVNIGVWTVSDLQTAITLREIGINNVMSNIYLEF